MAATDRKISVLFVCLGNTCRSTMAEGILRHLVKERDTQDKWIIDSAAIADWQVGRPVDPRTMTVLAQHGIEHSHRARQITLEDYKNSDFIFGMDPENVSDLNAFKPDSFKGVIQLLGQYDPEKKLIIEDPFCDYTPDKFYFKQVYEQCLRCCQSFLNSME